jgi:hypothetical protein
MQETLGVNLSKAIQNRYKNVYGLIFADSATTLTRQVLGQSQPIVVIHDQIGRAVLLEEIPDPNDVGMIQLRQCPGFLQELVQAIGKTLGILVRMRGDGLMVDFATGQITRQVFLDGDLGQQALIPAQVGNAKTARLTQHLAHQIAPMVQHPQMWQYQGRAFQGAVIAAVRTDTYGGLILETTGARQTIHDPCLSGYTRTA